MTNKNLLGSLSLTLTLFAATAASASPLTFDFADGSAPHSMGSEAFFTIGDITTRVTSNAGAIHQNGQYGLGVEGGAGGNRIAAYADGSLAEALIFDFTPTSVQLLDAVTFERAGNGSSDFELFVDGITHGVFTIGGSDDNLREVVSFASMGLAGEVFEFRARPSGNGFRIAELSVSVPEPGTIALVAAGLLLLAATLRRPRRAPALRTPA